MAISEGFDAIALLDADNWYRPDHIASLVALYRQTGASLCTSARSLHRMDGSLLTGHDSHSDGATFADTSTLFYLPEAYGLLPLWGRMPEPFHVIGDRIMWSAVQARKVAAAHSGLATMAYRTSHCAHYRHLGENPPGCKEVAVVDRSILRWNALPAQEKVRILLCQ